MPNCFKCGDPIQFDPSVRSKTGKQIPLNPDRSYHSHEKEEDGGQGQQQQYNKPSYSSSSSYQQKSFTPSSSGSISGSSNQGGQNLDTKRLRVMVEDMQKGFEAMVGEFQALQATIHGLREEMQNAKVIDSNLYDGQMKQIYDAVGDKIAEQSTLSAAELMKKKEDNAMINHSKRVDNRQGFLQGKELDKRIPEDKEYPPLDKLKDDPDMEGVD